jgi:hypothetical protein
MTQAEQRMTTARTYQTGPDPPATLLSRGVRHFNERVDNSISHKP